MPRYAGASMSTGSTIVPLSSRRGLGVGLAAAVLFPAVAHAHAILEESSPAAGARVAAGHVALLFRYNSRIDRTRSRLTLIRPDKSRDTLPIDADGPPDMLTASATLTPGEYIVRWQVLAIDGHITRGDVPLTVVEH